jgi:uncharacterized membrane protein YkgB
MQAIKTLETKNHTYYYGYISKYERTEAEKTERNYMIVQKGLGIAAIIIAILILLYVKDAEFKAWFSGILFFLGSILTFSKYHAF